MSSPTRYVRGQWKAVCDVCGQRFDNIDMQKRWDGLMVCKRDWEPRQPQDFVRAKVDIQSLPWTRPESTEYTFIPVSNPYVAGNLAGYLIAGNIPGIEAVPPSTFTV